MKNPKTYSSDEKEWRADIIIQEIEALKVIKSEAEHKIQELRLRLINLLKL